MQRPDLVEYLRLKVWRWPASMPMIGRFAFDAPPSHAGQPIGNLYCSSWIVVRKSLDFVPDVDKYGNFDWRKALPSVIGDTIYPPNTGLSS